MSTLQAELNRLYRPHEPSSPDPQETESGLIAPDDSVRALVLELGRPADWTLLSTVWRGVQTDLEWPAPAIAVSGVDAYQLWFSLAEPVSALQAGALLEALRVRYLSLVAPARIAKWPRMDTSTLLNTQHALRVPALHEATSRWSAFVAPDLAAIFADEPWLDLAPNPEAQAKVLARLESIKPTAFHGALEKLCPGRSMKATAMTPMAHDTTGNPPRRETQAPGLPESDQDARGFLVRVMNDKTVELHLRIEAAKALLLR